MWILILTVVVNFSAPAVTTASYSTKKDCEFAGLQHKNAVEREKLRATVVYTCSPIRD